MKKFKLSEKFTLSELYDTYTQYPVGGELTTPISCRMCGAAVLKPHQHMHWHNVIIVDWDINNWTMP